LGGFCDGVLCLLQRANSTLVQAPAGIGEFDAPVAGGLRTKASASDNSVSIEFAKGAVFSQDTTLAARYRAERTELGGALKRELLPRIPSAVLEVLPDVGHLSLLEAPKEIAHRLDTFAQEFQSRPEARAGV
jgi:hypothetical protein